jgi:nucleotide-binding universal stress UspA family protein
VQVVLGDDVASAILDAASQTDLVVLGLNKPDRRRRVFGPLSIRVIQEVRSAVMAIGQRE